MVLRNRQDAEDGPPAVRGYGLPPLLASHCLPAAYDLRRTLPDATRRAYRPRK